ncbi:MAG: ABC transporter substrate-binding protein [Actinomycetota bacterium]
MNKQSKPWMLLVALLAAFSLVAAACGDDDEDEATEASDSASESDPAPAEEEDDMADEEGPHAGLASCPNPIVIQTDWFPEPEHGAMYNLTAGEGSIDPESGRFTGPLAVDPSIDIEIRAGGPFIGFQDTISLMATDSDIFVGFINTDEQTARYADFPTTAVFAPLEINPQMIMWDPNTYDVSSWDDVLGTGAIINIFAGGYYPEWLVGSGLVDADQLDPSYDGGPARFIAEGGAIMQQGFETQEPFNYEFIFTEWGQPVETLLIHDSGYEIYQGAVGILDANLDDAASECLSALVPVMQQSAVDFAADPVATNAAILQAVIDLDTFWELSEDSVVATHDKMHGDLGIVSNGSNATLGDFDLDRLQGVLDLIDAQVPTIDRGEVGIDDLVTNEFIDTSIGLP